MLISITWHIILYDILLYHMIFYYIILCYFIILYCTIFYYMILYVYNIYIYDAYVCAHISLVQEKKGKRTSPYIVHALVLTSFSKDSVSRIASSLLVNLPQ